MTIFSELPANLAEQAANLPLLLMELEFPDTAEASKCAFFLNENPVKSSHRKRNGTEPSPFFIYQLGPEV